MGDSMEMLRLATAGSVDDGKSTLIGRLLYDSKAIFEDQLEAVERTSRERGDEYTNLALLTDGLRAEREQGITIDVAYRYFATPKRKFIIADTPGHIQYTRNMVTGASTADLALILIDARKGVLEQSRRHAFLASLLGIPHLVLCVNKMDLVDWSEDRFEEIKAEFRAFAMKLDVHDLTFIPVSALHGDNVVDRSANMPWYEGGALLHHLEEVHIASDRNLIDARFPVQYVIRPQNQTDLRPRLPRLRRHGRRRRVQAGRRGRRAAVGLHVHDRVDRHRRRPGRRGLRADVGHAPPRRRDRHQPRRHDRPPQEPAPRRARTSRPWSAGCPRARWLREGAKLAIKHTTRWARALVKDLQYRLDVNTLHRDEDAVGLALNEIGRVTLRTTVPLFYDEYRRNRTTGQLHPHRRGHQHHRRRRA